jgi:acylglycerol lipase
VDCIGLILKPVIYVTMNHFDWTWKQQGETIYAQGWNPPHPKGVICIIHGFTEHSSRYSDAAGRLGQAGYAVLTYDQFGHGKTTGKRGHADYDAFLDSVKIILQEAETRFPGVKKFLWGHSMGGGIVLNYVLKHHPALAGVIATGPLLKLSFEPPAVKMLLAKIMARIYPAFTQPAELDTDAISRDVSEVLKEKNDPYNHGKISAGTFLGMYQAGQWNLMHASSLQIPLLLMHGTADRLTSPEGSKEFASRAPKGKVTLKFTNFITSLSPTARKFLPTSSTG